MCYDSKEVNSMENENLDNIPQEEPVYKPRAKWQVWAARAGLVLFLLFVVYQLLTLFRGGSL